MLATEERKELVNRIDAIRKVVEAYKVCKGIEKGSNRSKSWDKCNWSRAAKAAKMVLEAFGAEFEQPVIDLGAIQKSVAFTIFQADQWNEAELAWTLETVARHAWDDGIVFLEKQRNEIGLERRKLLE